MRSIKRMSALLLSLVLLVSGLPVDLTQRAADRYGQEIVSDVAVVDAAAAKPTDLSISIKKKRSSKVTVTAKWSASADYYNVDLSYSTPTGATGTVSGTVAENSMTYDFKQSEGINYTYTLKVAGVSYDGSQSATAQKTKKYRLVGKATKKVKKIIKKNIKSSWSDYQKVKYVHDWMIKNISYDQSETIPAKSFTFAGAILKKKAVCKGYAETFMVFMELLGIPVKYVPSVEQGNHAWNMVKVSGKWYHIDVTWDDPLGMDSVTNSYPVYDYFLQSTNNFQSKSAEKGNGYEHFYSTSKFPKCSSTTYDNDGSKEGYWEAVPGDTSGSMYNDTFSVWKNGVAQ